jgi:hypothetical protein
VIYICIPALNEARTIGVLLWKIRQVMEEFPRDYHVLVLDDGSTDDTREVLEPYLRVLPVTVLRNEKTSGYAPAVERLIREAVRLSTHPKRDGVVVMQADFTESPDDIPHLLKRLEGGADVVGSSVTGTEGELPRSLRWGRRGLPWLVSRAPLPREIKDPLSGFRAYRVSVLKRALQDRDGKPLLTKHGWAANAELLLCITPHVRRAEDAEVSLRYTRRERPTRFRPWSTAVELWDFVRQAPRRLAEARAAAATADAQRPAKPPRAPEPAVAEAPRQPRPQRAPEASAAAPSEAEPRRQRPPRNRNRNRNRGERQQGGEGQPPLPSADAEPQAPAGEAQPRRERQRQGNGQRQGDGQREHRPRPQAQQPSADAPPDAAEQSAAASPEQPADAPPKRKRPPRPRRPRNRKPQGAVGEGGEAAGGDPASADTAGGGEVDRGGDVDRGDAGSRHGDGGRDVGRGDAGPRPGGGGGDVDRGDAGAPRHGDGGDARSAGAGEVGGEKDDGTRAAVWMR